MRLLLLIILCLALVSYTFGQSRLGYGPKVALNVSNVNFGDLKVAHLTHKARAGIAFGVFVDYKFNDWFGAQAEAMYSTQGAKITRETAPVAEGKLIANYINVPIFAKFYALSRLHVDVGPQVGFIVRKKIEIGDEVIEPEFHSADLSFVMGVGYEFGFGLCLDARYVLGVTDVMKKAEGERLKSKNGVFQFGAAYRF